MVRFRNARLSLIIIFLSVFLNTNLSHAKTGDDQDVIILLNDVSAALEDINPGLSTRLSTFADEKEKEWEAKNANKELPKAVDSDRSRILLQEHLALLHEASAAVKPYYPIIAQKLNRAADDMKRKNQDDK